MEEIVPISLQDSSIMFPQKLDEVTVGVMVALGVHHCRQRGQETRVGGPEEASAHRVGAQVHSRDIGRGVVGRALGDHVRHHHVVQASVGLRHEPEKQGRIEVIGVGGDDPLAGGHPRQHVVQHQINQKVVYGRVDVAIA